MSDVNYDGHIVTFPLLSKNYKEDQKTNEITFVLYAGSLVTSQSDHY